MSILMFSQALAGALFLAFADVIFSAGPKSLILKDAPNVDSQAIIAAGATGLRDVVQTQDWPGCSELTRKVSTKCSTWPLRLEQFD
ncbi:uncharacterized protein P174DRAFT_288124 [Aspergillus novofumigatus IBT 16806]|uniref:Uncharacterized protein n=1 Tax=Aspergillus novofumigatus (strain IBT 16806) TaxID=1392255 RepID=A0A2I1BX84_ASPN1|nr:uncharacterized protein P174DRAFT_288124 [Aspergillus novofumigatus IBT 16806]PKX89993.1 hypothetical protein P174DRAFT_288124 [Aspergillus novofumigatus IBT 16806]